MSSITDHTRPGDADFTRAFERALANEPHVMVPEGVFTVSEPVRVRYEGQTLRGEGGEARRSRIVSYADSGPVALIGARSVEISGLHIDADESRRLTTTSTGHGVMFSGGDVASPNFLSRCVADDIFISNQPTDGFVTIGTLEMSRFNRVQARDCLRHGFVADGGTIEGHTTNLQPIFEATWENCRALECAGNALILKGADGDAATGARFNIFEALGCGWDVAKRISENQIVVEASQVVFDHLDCEDQQYAEDITAGGMPKTARLIPSSGVSVSGGSISFHRPFFSSLIRSLHATGCKGLEILHPRVFAKGYPVPQAHAFEIDATVGPFRFVADTSQTSGAANLLKNQNAAADISIDGRHYRGLSTTVCDWQVSGPPLDATVSGGTLEVHGSVVNVIGETDPDTVSNIRIASGVTAPDGLEVQLQYAGDEVTFNHSAGLITKTGSGVTLSPSAPLIKIASFSGGWVQV